MQFKNCIYGLLVIAFLLNISSAEPVLSSEAEDLIRKEFRVDSFSTCELNLPEGESLDSIEIKILYKGRVKVLELRKHSVRALNLQVLVQRAGGRFEKKAELPVTTYRGGVKGEDESHVAGSLMPDGFSANCINGEGTG